MKRNLLFLALFLFIAAGSSAKPEYVWNTPIGNERGQYVYFRNEVELSTLPSKAELNLYAYSRYALIINGEYINFGPSRSTKEHPYYDTYDIRPNLKTGTNVIAVEAMNNGIGTFQIPYGTAAFIAWGDIVADGQTIDLATPGNWICRAAKGYESEVQRFSFAQGAIENFDARKEPDDWRGLDIIAKEWKKPVVVQTPEEFGELTPRIIPPLTQEVFTPKKCLLMSNKEYFGSLYNFQVLSKTINHYDNGGKGSVQMYTYIYSPEAQVLYIPLSWGEYWINGKKIDIEKSEIPFQEPGRVALEAGWNLLFGNMEIVFGGTEFMMILPDDKGLIVSADQGNDPKKGLAVSGPNAEKTVEDPTTFKPAKKDKRWEFVPAQSLPTNPAKTVAWKRERRMKLEKPIKQSNFELSSEKLNNVLFDMGQKLLGRVFVEVEAPVGAVIDITFAETLNEDGNMDLYRMITVNAGVRYISKGGVQRFESFRPYGVRYMQVTVSDDTSPVYLDKVGVISQIYPFEKLGSFACSDPMLTAIWEMGWRTLRVCSEDSYVDTPFRERGHYAGDMYPEYAISLALSGDSRLAKHTVRMFLHSGKVNYFGDGNNMGNDFTAINLLVATWLIRMTDDQEFAEEVYPYLKNYLQRWYEQRTPKGFYHPKSDTFFEWLKIDKKAALTQFQTFIYRLYQEMSYLAGRVNDNEQVQIANDRAKETKEMINDVFWGGIGNGVFFDGIDTKGRYLTTRFPNSSLIPMAYGITTKEQDNQIIAKAKYDLLGISLEKNDIPRISSYGGFYALAGLYAKENAGLAEQFIRTRWSPMIYTGDDTAWEDFDLNDKSWTLSHAWSCGPTYFLSTQTLGVQLGYPEIFDPENIIIAPQSESLDWAKGTVVHPKGLVSVSWRVAGKNLYLDYTAPEGVPVKIEPRGRLAKYNLILNHTQK